MANNMNQHQNIVFPFHTLCSFLHCAGSSFAQVPDRPARGQPGRGNTLLLQQDSTVRHFLFLFVHGSTYYFSKGPAFFMWPPDDPHPPLFPVYQANLLFFPKVTQQSDCLKNHYLQFGLKTGCILVFCFLFLFVFCFLTFTKCLKLYDI